VSSEFSIFIPLKLALPSGLAEGQSSIEGNGCVGGYEGLFTKEIHLPCRPYLNGLFIELIIFLITHNHFATSFLLFQASII
jgi:hypothetical protein